MPDPVDGTEKAGQQPAAEVANDNNSTAAEQSAFRIPDAYKDKPYLKDVNTEEDLFKKLDGAESLLGKARVAVPGEDATPEEIAEFHKALGVPENEDGYKSSLKADGDDDNIDTSLFDAMRPAFKKAGLTAKQAQEFEKNALPILEKMAEQQGLKKQQEDDNFDELASRVFGDTREKDISDAKNLLNQFTPDVLKSHLSDLSNEALVIMAGTLKGIRDKYISEDNLSFDKKGKSVSGTNPDDVRKSAIEQLKIANDPTKTSEEQAIASEKAQKLYDQYDKLTK